MALTVAWPGEAGDAVHGEREAKVVMRAAPFVLASNLQPARAVVVRAYPGRNDAMIQQLRTIVTATDAELIVLPGEAPYPANHVWVQDAVEFGHAWTGRPDAPAVALPSNRDRGLDRFAERLTGRHAMPVLTVGSYREAFAAGRGGDQWIDWFGNLEVSPPTAKHPFGRVIYGVNPDTGASLNPEVVAFLAAQGMQPPLASDTGWLNIKHVDETFSFIPSGDPDRPFRMMVPDPEVAVRLLASLRERGHGDAPMLERFEQGTTVASLLADHAFLEHNATLKAERLDPYVDHLKAELGLDDADVIRLPVLFTPGGNARVPNVVNALVVNGHVIMADPDGPSVDGHDAFQRYAREALAGLPVAVHFVDDRLYHRWSGNVHCATNTIREPIVPWQAPTDD
jgi:protein-arginine deiminase